MSQAVTRDRSMRRTRCRVTRPYPPGCGERGLDVLDRGQRIGEIVSHVLRRFGFQHLVVDVNATRDAGVGEGEQPRR
jgi:hypothetical protein